jgi:hypothetical protein
MSRKGIQADRLYRQLKPFRLQVRVMPGHVMNANAPAVMDIAITIYFMPD